MIDIILCNIYGDRVYLRGGAAALRGGLREGQGYRIVYYIILYYIVLYYSML